MNISDALSKSVLTTGVQFKNHRGGIGGVIATYEKYFTPFYFIPTYKPQRFKWLIILYYIYHVLLMAGTLVSKPSIKIVHIHGAAKGSFYRKCGIFFIARYLFGKKVIYHSHGSEFKDFYANAGKFSRAWIRHFFRHIDLVICLSESWRNYFLANFSVKDIIVLENIVEKSAGCADITSVVVHGETIEFLFLGAIGNRKGVFDLLTAIARHKQEFIGKLHLTIGGNGEVEKLQQLILAEGLTELVSYKGWLTGVDKQNAIAQSHVYVLPSYNEGLPLSILEAMSFGKAIISTPVGGIAEIVQPGYNGFLVTPGNVDEIANALLQCIHNPSLVMQMGKCSQQRVMPYYAEEVIPKLASLYNHLLLN